MDKLKELQKQLEEIEQQIIEQSQEDAIAGYGWGRSDKSWELNRKKYTLIKQLQDLTNPQTYDIISPRGENNEKNRE